ncbi:hypothetical protein CDIK_4286 [Cucumispora dikerogammari]|nr:hypothetical protein CDIK_4286 [Cucumispora dikerogammari]
MLAILSRLSTIHCPDYIYYLIDEEVKIELLPIDNGELDAETREIKGFFNLKYMEKEESGDIIFKAKICVGNIGVDFKNEKSSIKLFILKKTKGELEDKTVFEYESEKSSSAFKSETYDHISFNRQTNTNSFIKLLKTTVFGRDTNGLQIGTMKQRRDSFKKIHFIRKNHAINRVFTLNVEFIIENTKTAQKTKIIVWTKLFRFYQSGNDHPLALILYVD